MHIHTYIVASREVGDCVCWLHFFTSQCYVEFRQNGSSACDDIEKALRKGEGVLASCNCSIGNSSCRFYLARYEW